PTTRRCRRIIGAKSRHLDVAVITSNSSATARKNVTCARAPSDVHAPRSVWVDVSPLSSCVAPVVAYDQDICAEPVAPRPCLPHSSGDIPCVISTRAGRSPHRGRGGGRLSLGDDPVGRRRRLAC